MNFTTWLIKIEGFSSKYQYDYLVSNLPYVDRRKVQIYYREKYKYYISTQPKQLEIKIN
jgi:methylase of polypeptide subunit release factors